jgi:hypothetical protein
VPPTDATDETGGDLWRTLAAAADLCLAPHRHAVVPDDIASLATTDSGEICVRIKPRRADGERLSAEDVELEIYRSGGALHLMLSWPEQPERPILWQGDHPVWMDGVSGMRCDRPACGVRLEALARRLRALLSPDR